MLFFVFINLLLISSSSTVLNVIPCPLNFDLLHDMVTSAPWRPSFADVPSRCQDVKRGISFLRSEFLSTNGNFFPPPITSATCWAKLRYIIDESWRDFDIDIHCGHHPEWFVEGCANITTRIQLEAKISRPSIELIKLYCNQSLVNTSVCESCNHKLLSIANMYLQDGDGNGNRLECSMYMFMYAAAFVNQFGPANEATSKCLFQLKFAANIVTAKPHTAALSGLLWGCVLGILGSILAIWIFWVSHTKCKLKKKILVDEKKNHVEDETRYGFFSNNPSLVKFRMEEIKMATMNFSRENIIGKGGYGNVYKGTLRDGLEVALKRFKNCSALGDAIFEHELEIIASVRHVNLVSLKGYCTATIPMEGHQRIIVCELMHNGSLYDHLFGSPTEKLSWPMRRKIAIGTARGLCYLHHGVHPAIIHRDIKASNILLDNMMEPKVADFGLAKFNPAGTSHMSTKVAGTLGYVAPEYALYGKLTQGSDVYSFGVVLLELLSGKRAYENKEGNRSLLAEWAWSLVQQGRAIDVVEKDMDGLEGEVIMEKYVYIATLCAHPILQGRPSMDQIVNILEAEQIVSSILPSGRYVDRENISVSSSYMSTGSSVDSHHSLVREINNVSI